MGEDRSIDRPRRPPKSYDTIKDGEIAFFLALGDDKILFDFRCSAVFVDGDHGGSIFESRRDGRQFELLGGVLRFCCIARRIGAKFRNYTTGFAQGLAVKAPMGPLTPL